MRCECFLFTAHFAMKLSTWRQKWQLSLTALTWMGFVVICALWGSYGVLLRHKELTTQNREWQYLRAENSRLTVQNQELEQQAAALRARLAESGTAAAGEKNPNGELTEGRQRSFSYTVKKGDTIWDIAKMYNVEGQALMRWNHLNPRSQIFPGDTLTIMLKE